MKSLLISHILNCYLEGYCDLGAVYEQLGTLGWSDARITMVTVAVVPQFGFSDN